MLRLTIIAYCNTNNPHAGTLVFTNSGCEYRRSNVIYLKSLNLYIGNKITVLYGSVSLILGNVRATAFKGQL